MAGVARYLATAGAVMALGWSTAASAWTGQVVWETFTRTGPGQQYAVIDELLRGTTVEVVSCGDQYCLVRYERSGGYVDRASVQPLDLAGAAAPVTPAPAQRACFDSRRAGYGGGDIDRYCPR